MTSVPAIDFETDYRFRDGVTPLSAETFNRRLLSIHARLTRMEQITYSFDALATELSTLGLARINALILPQIDRAHAELAGIADILIEAQAKLQALKAANLDARNILLAGGGTVETAIATLPGMATAIESLSAAMAALPTAASQADAEGGTEPEALMTPLRTAQAIAVLAPTGIANMMKYGAL
jgi:hypothetical protein